MSLDIRVYQRTFQPHANKFIKAFIDGLKRHRIKAQWLHESRYTPSDLAVIWGVRFPQIIEGQKKNNADYLVIERGYFRNRLRYCALGYNGLNGYAEFYVDNSPSDRWEKHGVQVKPWKEEGEYILLMGQIGGDQSVKHCNINKWYQEMISKIKEITDIPIYFRPHPNGRKKVDISGIAGIKDGELEEALEGALKVITFNSNSGVDAVINGVPVIAMDRGSMVWEVAQNEIRLENELFDREQWLNDLAYKQWTMKEMASGETWEYLRRKYD